MGLVISKGLTLARTFDPEITAYIAAVEAADEQALEPAVKTAYINFILGCKADGIWNAIKASCILAGARTLEGALVPLVGAAPTNVGELFVAGDYNRKTGLVGNGSTKYLNSNYLWPANFSLQNDAHTGFFVSTQATGTYCGAGADNEFLLQSGAARFFSAAADAFAATVSPSFIGVSRSSSADYALRLNSSSSIITRFSSAVGQGVNVNIFRRGAASVATLYSSSRLAFYSIGESLDLALLDARVTDLINAFGAAIP